MSDGRIDVSVIMAAWSAADFIAPAIRSALNQQGVSLELIIIDDASPDHTVEAARSAGAGDPRLRVESLPENGGPSAARNRALDLAQGRYVAILDSDDSFEPGRLEALVRLADECRADIVADNMTRVSRLGARASEGEPFLSWPEPGPVEISLADYLSPRTEARFGQNLGYLKPLFRRVKLEEGPVRYDTRLRNSEDFYLVAELLARGARMVVSADRFYNYLVREGSISHRLNPELTGAILEAEADFAARHGASFSPEAARAQADRQRALRHVHAFECVLAGLKTRRPGAVLSGLTGNPDAIGHVAGRLTGIGWTKLTRSRR